ncbi:MAG: hypothetical protein KGS72_11580 [Cyanobacteria bacterium REEB67]|nr:hypothetical protein [Cyanobacteria bacterium REEB67]
MINGSSSTTVETSSGEVFNAKVIDEDEINDLAHLKLLGITKDPSRSVTISDEREIKSGTPMLGVGHPGGYHGAIVADGEAVAQGPWVLLYDKRGQAEMSKESAQYAALHPEHKKDAIAALLAEKILMDTPWWFGRSDRQ